MFGVGSYARQYGIVITANLNNICAGIALSWASPVLVKLSDSENVVLSQPVTESESSWIVTAAFIGGLCSLLLLPLIINNIGRKFTIILLSVPRLACYLLMIFAIETWMIILGRFLMGFADCAVISAVNIYSSEIANPQIRGSLGTLLHLFTSLGILIILSYGPFVSFRMLNVIALCISICTSLPSFFLPDSPYFLYTKGKIDESKLILLQLRGNEMFVEEEIKEYDINLNKKERISLKEIINTKRYMKSIGIAVFLNVMANLTGYSVLTIYLQTLFVASQSNFSPEFSSLIVGLIQLVACIGATIVIDKFGRKPILLFGQSGVVIGFVVLGLFFLLAVEEIVGLMNYLPLISIAVIVFSYNLGMGSIINPLIAELLDGKIRVLGVTLGTISGLISISMVVALFQLLLTLVGETAVFWTFAVTSAILCIFIAFVIPETNGMSFREIQEGLNGEIAKGTQL